MGSFHREVRIVEREACSKVNKFLRKFSINSILSGISYLPLQSDWILPNGDLDGSLINCILLKMSAPDYVWQ